MASSSSATGRFAQEYYSRLAVKRTHSVRSNASAASSTHVTTSVSEAAPESSHDGHSHGGSDGGGDGQHVLFRVVPPNRLPEGEYDDNFLFDSLRHVLPGADGGRKWLLLSLLVQAGVIAIAFLSHHKDVQKFDCCNMWAVLVAMTVVFVQVPYYADWLRGGKGHSPDWHRGNIFVPFIVFAILFFAWSAGTLSMLAHVIDIQVFDWVNFDRLNAVEALSFVVCTFTGLPALALLFTIDYTHRNNLGRHYYYAGESPGAVTFVREKPTKNEGAIDFCLLPYHLARALRVDTSLRAEDNLPRLIVIVTALQLPFYIFAGVAYTQGRDSNLAAVTVLGVGFMVFAFNWQYFAGALSNTARRTRRWNREYLWLPTYVGICILMVYVVSMSGMFFKTTEEEIWEAVDNLDTQERVYLYFGFALLVVLFAIQFLLANVHRKVWAEARDHDLGVRDPYLVRAEQAVMGVSLLPDMVGVDDDSDGDEKGAGDSGNLGELERGSLGGGGAAKARRGRRVQIDEQPQRLRGRHDYEAHKLDHKRRGKADISFTEHPAEIGDDDDDDDRYSQPKRRISASASESRQKAARLARRPAQASGARATSSARGAAAGGASDSELTDELYEGSSSDDGHGGAAGGGNSDGSDDEIVAVRGAGL